MQYQTFQLIETDFMTLIIVYLGEHTGTLEKYLYCKHGIECSVNSHPKLANGAKSFVFLLSIYSINLLRSVEIST